MALTFKNDFQPAGVTYKPLKAIIYVLMFFVVGFATSGSIFAAFNIIPGIIGVQLPAMASLIISPVLFLAGALYWGTSYASSASRVIDTFFTNNNIKKQLNQKIINDYNELSFVGDYTIDGRKLTEEKNYDEIDIINTYALLHIIDERKKYFDQISQSGQVLSKVDTTKMNILDSHKNNLETKLNNYLTSQKLKISTKNYQKAAKANPYVQYMEQYFVAKSQKESSVFKTSVVYTSQAIMFLVLLLGITNAFLVNTFGLTSGALGFAAKFMTLSHASILNITFIASISGIIAALALTMKMANSATKTLMHSWLNSTASEDSEYKKTYDEWQSKRMYHMKKFDLIHFHNEAAPSKEQINNHSLPIQDQTSIALLSAFLFACAVCGFNFISNLSAGHVLFTDLSLIFQFHTLDAYVASHLATLSPMTTALGLLGGVVTFAMVFLMMSESVINKPLPSKPKEQSWQPSSIIRPLAILANLVTLSAFTLFDGSIWVSLFGASLVTRALITASFSIPLIYLTNSFFKTLDANVNQTIYMTTGGQTPEKAKDLDRVSTKQTDHECEAKLANPNFVFDLNPSVKN
ncbi:MAG: hypothetical protein ACON5A_04280 [Candidatus Comchoanobacterales bacterium]